jgi:hypothetical protein
MKPTRYTLDRIAKAIQTAHDDSSLSGEADDRLVQASIEDTGRRKARGWKDTVVVVDDGAEAPPVDDTDSTYPSSPCEATTATPGTEPENRDLVEARAESSARNGNGEAEAPPSVEEGYGFVWCLDCRRLDRIRYENRTLPEYFEGGVGEQKYGIVLILCGLCRRTPARITVAKSQLESRILLNDPPIPLGFSYGTGFQRNPRPRRGSYIPPGILHPTGNFVFHQEFCILPGVLYPTKGFVS